MTEGGTVVGWLTRVGSELARLFAPLSRRELTEANLLGWSYRDRGRVGSTRVTDESALRHSAVWACLRLRADLISSMPVDVFRKVGDVQVEVKPAAWLVSPWEDQTFGDWSWGRQFDLDRYGNAVGLVHKRDQAGRMLDCEPLPMGDLTVLTKGRRITGYRVNGEVIPPEHVWHERQYRAAGVPVGMSPLSYAAMSVGGYLSAQQFALDWYDAGASPAGVLRSTVVNELPPGAARAAKERFKEATRARDIFVTGKSWEWTPAAGDANSAAFLDEMRYGISDVCRFLGVPGDMIDAPGGGSNVTYANVTQRNVQLLVMHLGPAVKRREDAASLRLSAPQFVKFNSDAVLRMDPLTRAQVLQMQVNSRAILPSEWRQLDNRQPYDEAGYAEFDRLFGAPKSDAPMVAQRALRGDRPDFEPPALVGWHLPRELESGRG